MSIYCISDIHGKREEFYKMLKKINFKEEDHLYVIGDIIDRYEEGVELFQELTQMDNVTIIKGNHEDMCYKSMTSDMDEFNNWTIKNGGDVTHKALMKLDSYSRYKFLGQIKELPLYKFVTVNDRKFLLVHAGLYNYKRRTLEELLELQYTNLLWIRGLFLADSFNNFDCTIVFGHTITASIPWEITGEYPKDYKENWGSYVKNSYIWESENKIGIDCGASSGGRLACLRLDDLEKFYVEC